MELFFMRAGIEDFTASNCVCDRLKEQQQTTNEFQWQNLNISQANSDHNAKVFWTWIDLVDAVHGYEQAQAKKEYGWHA